MRYRRRKSFRRRSFRRRSFRRRSNYRGRRSNRPMRIGYRM